MIYNRIFCAQSLSHVQLCVTPWTASHQAVHSCDFSGKNTGLSCYFSSGDLLNSGIKPASPVLVGIFFTTEPLEKPYNGILLSHNMSEIMPFAATWMNLEIIRWRKTNIIWYHLYVKSKKKKEEENNKNYVVFVEWTYLQSRKRPRDVENKLRVTKGLVVVGGDKWGVWDYRYTVLYIKI